MNESDDTKDLTDKLSDRQLLLELRQMMGVLSERMTELERRTNPLPPNYDARFAALERNVQESNLELRGIREDLERERRQRFSIEDRLTQIEARVA
jgi:hypothetical protein